MLIFFRDKVVYLKVWCLFVCLVVLTKNTKISKQYDSWIHKKEFWHLFIHQKLKNIHKYMYIIYFLPSLQCKFIYFLDLTVSELCIILNAEVILDSFMCNGLGGEGWEDRIAHWICLVVLGDLVSLAVHVRMPGY